MRTAHLLLGVIHRHLEGVLQAIADLAGKRTPEEVDLKPDAEVDAYQFEATCPTLEQIRRVRHGRDVDTILN